MSEDRCPNCRAERFDGELACRQCGWMPLRSTEMLFVDDQDVVCPHCGRHRPLADDACPHCGGHDVLESAAKYTANFRISSLMLLTSLFAVCFALGRIAVVLGIVAFTFLALALLRTMLLVRQRKRFRYPVASRDLMRMFGQSLLGIIAAGVVFGMAGVAIGFVLAAFFSTIAWNGKVGAIVVFVLLVAGSQAGAVVMVGRRRESRRMMLIGLLAAWAVGICILTIVGSISRGVAETVAMMIFLNIGTVALLLACRRGGAVRAKGWIVGCSVGLCSLGGSVMLIASNRFGYSFGDLFSVSSFLIWPTLLSIMALEGMWSWDDAFPQVAARFGPVTPESETPTSAGIFIVDEEDVEFPGTASEDDEERVEADVSSDDGLANDGK